MESVKLERFQELITVSGRPDYEGVLEALMEEIFAERGCFWLEAENEFIYFGDEELRRKFPFSRQAVDKVLEENGQGVVTYDDEDASESMVMHNVRSCICVACKNAKGDVLVLAYFDNGINSEPFSDEERNLIQDVLNLMPGAVSPRTDVQL